MPRRRSPQEKKALSYARDRRNDYGENDKSSRRNIPLSKRIARRADRRIAATALAAGRGGADADSGAAAQERAERRRPGVWRKWPDGPLGVHVECGLERRARAEGGKGRNADRLGRLRARLRRPGR
ncbi:hypothetical protein GCM10009551_000650 [Nocardiopsis tropica]|uniref:hypothetical protein n=1 Tax=Nocardiopsis tropica TaxID=109330 RepID=UPI0031E2CBCC